MLQIPEAKAGRRAATLNGQIYQAPAQKVASHCLDPLSASEILATSKACREHAETLEGLPSLRFNSVHVEVSPSRGGAPRPSYPSAALGTAQMHCRRAKVASLLPAAPCRSR